MAAVVDQTRALAESALGAAPPVADAAQPVVDGAQPVVDAAQPVVDAAQHVLDAAQPVVNAAQPVVDAAKHFVDAAQPVVDGAQPVLDAAQPVLDAAQPVLDAAQPVADAAQPVVDAAQPVVDAAQPVVDAAQPVVDAAQPVVDAAQPVVDAAQPVLDAAQPVVNAAQPVVNAAQPVVNAAQPVGPTLPQLADNGGGGQVQPGAIGAVSADLFAILDAAGVQIATLDRDVSTLADPGLATSTVAADGQPTSSAGAAELDTTTRADDVRGASTMAERWPRFEPRVLEGSGASGTSAPWRSTSVGDELAGAGISLSNALASVGPDEAYVDQFDHTDGAAPQAKDATLASLNTAARVPSLPSVSIAGQQANKAAIAQDRLTAPMPNTLSAFRPGIVDRSPTPLEGLPDQSGSPPSRPRNAAAAPATFSLSTAGPPGSAPPAATSLRLVATWRTHWRLASLRPPPICLSSLTPPG